MSNRHNTYKYRNRIYRSKFELLGANYLYKKKMKFKYEHEHIPYRVKVHNAVCGACGENEVYQNKQYLPDFFLDNGIIVEFKGRFTSKDRTKMRAVVELNPEQDIRMLFQRDNRISRNSGTTYVDWCERVGIKCAVHPYGEVPDDWLEEKK